MARGLFPNISGENGGRSLRTEKDTFLLYMFSELLLSLPSCNTCLYWDKWNLPPQFKNAVAHIYKRCPPQPCNRCCLEDKQCHVGILYPQGCAYATWRCRKLGRTTFFYPREKRKLQNYRTAWLIMLQTFSKGKGVANAWVIFKYTCLWWFLNKTRGVAVACVLSLHNYIWYRWRTTHASCHVSVWTRWLSCTEYS